MTNERVLAVDLMRLPISIIESGVTRGIQGGEAKEIICRQIKCSIQRFAESNYLENYVNDLIETYMEENPIPEPIPDTPTIQEVQLAFMVRGSGSIPPQLVTAKVYKYHDQVSISIPSVQVFHAGSTPPVEGNQYTIVGDFAHGNVIPEIRPSTPSQSVHLGHVIEGGNVDFDNHQILEYEVQGGLLGSPLLTITSSSPLQEGIELPGVTLTYLV